MSESEKSKTGTIGWTDLTVPNADEVRDFYRPIVGWKPEPVDMGGYNDYTMIAQGIGVPAAGICYRREVNADLPPQWLIYITVENVDQSAVLCTKHGGKIIAAPRDMGTYGRYCVIQDPSGAVAALFTPAER